MIILISQLLYIYLSVKYGLKLLITNAEMSASSKRKEQKEVKGKTK